MHQSQPHPGGEVQGHYHPTGRLGAQGWYKQSRAPDKPTYLAGEQRVRVVFKGTCTSSTAGLQLEGREERGGEERGDSGAQTSA